MRRGEYLQYLVVERGLAANTVQSYERDLRRYAEVLAARGKTDLNEVTSLDVAEFRAALRTGDESHPPLAVTSIGRAVVAVRGLHAFARAQGLTSDDPAREVAPPPPPRRLPKAITVDEVERLLEAAGSTGDPDPRALRDRALLEFLYSTGARISEVTDLDVDDLDHLAADPAVKLTGKGGKQRYVPVGSYAVAALDAYLVRGRPVLGRPRPRPGGRPHRDQEDLVRRVPERARRPTTRQGAWGVLARKQRFVQENRMCHSRYPAALLRHPPARRGRGHPGRAGVARTCLRHDSPQVYTLVTVGKLREVCRRRASPCSGITQCFGITQGIGLTGIFPGNLRS